MKKCFRTGLPPPPIRGQQAASCPCSMTVYAHPARRYRTERMTLPGLPQLSTLPGRAAFETALGAAVQAGRAFLLLVADLDELKLINDLHGHPVGDEAIYRLATALQEAAQGDVYAFGGDELAVIVQPDPDQALRRVQAALTSWRTAPLLTAPTVAVTASVGAARFPLDATTARGLYDVADRRMYTAKRSGGGRLETRDSGITDCP